MMSSVTMTRMAEKPSGDRLSVAGLFAGIGGIELGMRKAGHDAVLLCEIDSGASAVLKAHFGDTEFAPDVRSLRSLPTVDVVTAGFPCQDLSQAGRTAGISGANSGLVGEVFRLLDSRKRGPKWLVLENVSFMLQLDRGKAMRFLVDELEARGFTWAYRVVDSRAFGVPQRRRRVILVASRNEDPRGVLFADNAEPVDLEYSRDLLCGFYWTEGIRGLGWAVDAIPTLKGGSTIGIPSAPAIWNPRTGMIGTPAVRDAERIQGFPENWTLPSLNLFGVKRGHRWKLIGNAVTVPVAQWIGSRLARPGSFDAKLEGHLLPLGVAWPKAAWGRKGKVYAVDVSLWPVHKKRPALAQFLRHPVEPLSLRAAQGFKSRMEVSTLRFEPDFRKAVNEYVATLSNRTAVA